MRESMNRYLEMLVVPRGTRRSALVGLCTLTICGCSGTPPSPPSSTAINASDSLETQVAASSTEAAAVKTVVEVGEDNVQTPASPQNDGDSKTTTISDQVTKQEQVREAKDAEPAKKTSTLNTVVTSSPKAKPAKPPASPSPEQISRWAIPDDQPLQLIACYDGFSDVFVQSMATTPNGKQFVLGGAKLTLWNIADPNPVIDLIAKYNGKEIERPLRSIAISPDGKWLAAGDQKGMLRIWNLGDQSEAVSFKAHDGHMTQLAFSPNSEMLATTSYSGEVRLWNAANGKKLKSLKVSDQELARLVFLSDTLLATAGREASIWNVESGTNETVLTTGYVIGPALGLTSDRQLLAFSDSDSKTYLWDIQKSIRTGVTLHGASAHLIDFSPDGKKIAIHSGDSNIRIWDAARGHIVQVINGDGGRTTALNWLPGSNTLLVASERGRIRIWGTPESATSLGLQPIELPPIGSTTSKERKSFTSDHWQRIIDVRSFPRLPGAIPQWSDAGIAAYNVTASPAEAELFYRYYLGKSGWAEVTDANSALPGLNFRKDGCELNVSMTPITEPSTETKGNLQVSLQFAGNYDAGWLPKYSAVASQGDWGSFSSVSYRTKAKLTDVEVALLKQFHEAGWTAYTRLNASGTEEVHSRSLSMLQSGSVLTVSIGYPADSNDELFVQTYVSVSNKSLPIPPDAGWIEFDSSTDLSMVANTKMDLQQTAKFYDTEMVLEGWLVRDAGRLFKDDKGFMSYIRGQQDVLIRLVARPEGGTRVIVGNAEQSSWQLQPPPVVDKSAEKNGIEAADFMLPKGATEIKFDVDQKQILFDLPDVTPPKLIDECVKQLESLGWKRESAGLISDEYCFVTYLKMKTEIQVRIRGDGKKSSGMISGNGLLWSKPLPTPPVRVSYEAWLRRSRRDATLDRLDEFTEEMHKIPDSGGKNK